MTIDDFAHLGIRKRLLIFSAEAVLLAVKNARLHLQCARQHHTEVPAIPSCTLAVEYSNDITSLQLFMRQWLDQRQSFRHAAVSLPLNCATTFTL